MIKYLFFMHVVPVVPATIMAVAALVIAIRTRQVLAYGPPPR